MLFPRTRFYRPQPGIRTTSSSVTLHQYTTTGREVQGECNGGGFLDGDKGMFSGTELIALPSSKFPCRCKSTVRHRMSPQSQSPRPLMEPLQAMHQYDITDYNL